MKEGYFHHTELLILDTCGNSINSVKLRALPLSYRCPPGQRVGFEPTTTGLSDLKQLFINHASVFEKGGDSHEQYYYILKFFNCQGKILKNYFILDNIIVIKGTLIQLHISARKITYHVFVLTKLFNSLIPSKSF